jgi:hypothetical protein
MNLIAALRQSSIMLSALFRYSSMSISVACKLITAVTAFQSKPVETTPFPGRFHTF